MFEFECRCGHIWLDNRNLGCPMCGKQEDVIRRDYVIKQPYEFGAKYNKQGD
ncbi:hypothetical protein KAR91_78690 [Candidatus Pacearchaeota archaeon]|nr:hypothetical protein [Candidatus Pacearchaeota archaeon]